MKNIILSLLLGLCLLIIPACEDVIPFDDKESKPMMVTFLFACPDSMLAVQVTKSSFFLDISSDPMKDKDGAYLGIDDAVVTLYVNDVFKETMPVLLGSHGIYKAVYIPKANDKIRITVKAPSFSYESRGECIVPEICPISVDTFLEIKKEYMLSYEDGVARTDTSLWRRTYFEIKFTDNGAMDNYYGVAVLETGEHKVLNMLNQEVIDTMGIYLEVSTLDNTIFDGADMDEKILLFDDKKINGMEYTLNVYIAEQIFSKEDSIANEISAIRKPKIVQLFSFNKDTYLYHRSSKINALTSGSMFAEPGQVYSNITNGIGLVGAYSMSKKTY